MSHYMLIHGAWEQPRIWDDVAPVLRQNGHSVTAVFCYPPHAGLLLAATNVAIAAHDEGIEAIVNMSQISAREEAKSARTGQNKQ